MQPIMYDPYDKVLKLLRADKTPFEERERRTGIKAETWRDIFSGRVKNPRIDTLRAIAPYYLDGRLIKRQR